MVQPDGVHRATPDDASAGAAHPADAAPAAGSTCPWCAAPTAAAATRCAACGAAIAQREAIGDLMIPGLTSVDPALQDYDKRPLHLRGPSPSQGVASSLIVGAVAGGPIGVAAIGGVAAMAAAEYLGAGRGGPGGVDLESVGKPSQVVLQALDRLGHDPASADPPGTAAPDEAFGATPGGQPQPNAKAEDDGRSIWRDLPRAEDSGPRSDEEGIDG